MDSLKIKMAVTFILLLLLFPILSAYTTIDWKREWPKTNFSKKSVDLSEIISGGPPKDGIPSINKPDFEPVHIIDNLGDEEPVISLTINNDVRAYPIRILMFHEIVNDVVGGVPVAVTYCPLCNASMVYDRRIDSQTLEFGTTGKLRMSDMVMYDRQTESWWQQFIGEAIVGEMTGKKLTLIPSRIESFARFQHRNPNGKVLVQNSFFPRRYGTNPYVGYDSASWPFLYHGEYEGEVPPLSYVVMVDKEAWPLADVREQGTIKKRDLTLIWEQGQNSALDTREITEGRELGNVRVTRTTEHGEKEVIYSLPFAFAFLAFHPDGIIHTN